MKTKHFTPNWQKALLISTVILGGSYVSMTNNVVTPTQVIAATQDNLIGQATITVWDDTSNTVLSQTTGDMSESYLDVPIPTGYYAVKQQMLGVHLQTDGLYINPSENPSGNYVLHVRSNEDETGAIASGTVTSVDSQTGNILDLKKMSVSNTFYLKVTAPNGYHPAAKQLPHALVKGN